MSKAHRVIRRIEHLEALAEGRMKELAMAIDDRLPGGKGDSRPDSDFDPDELAMGIKIEQEHTQDLDIAKEIAKDHLSEFPDYYSRLTKMEKEAEAGTPPATNSVGESVDDFGIPVVSKDWTGGQKIHDLLENTWKTTYRNGLKQTQSGRTSPSLKTSSITSKNTSSALVESATKGQLPRFAVVSVSRGQEIAKAVHSRLWQTNPETNKLIQNWFKNPNSSGIEQVGRWHDSTGRIRLRLDDSKIRLILSCEVDYDVLYIDSLITILDKDAGDKYSDITERQVKTSCPTKLKLFRATKETLPSDIDPLYRGGGVFGDGTYYAFDKETSLGYANDEIYSIVAEYEFSFDKILCFKNNENVVGLQHSGDIVIKDPALADELGADEDSAIDSGLLMKKADELEYDAISLRGPHVDGGEQIVISNEANPSYRLLKISVISPFRDLLVKIAKATGSTIKNEPITSQFIVSDISPSKASKIEGILFDFSESYRKKLGESSICESAGIKVFSPEQVADSLKRGGREFESEEDLMSEAQDMADFLNSFPHTIEVYRTVHAKGKDMVSTDVHPGDHWTHSEQKAIQFARDNLERPWFLITGTVGHSDVDWAQTLFQNVHHPHEEELNIHKKDSVKIASIKQIK